MNSVPVSFPVDNLTSFLREENNGDEFDFSNPTIAFDYAVDVIQSDTPTLAIRGLDRFVLFVLRHFASLGRTLGVSDESNFVLNAYTAVARTCLRQQVELGNIHDATPIDTTNRGSTGSAWSETGNQSNANYVTLYSNNALLTAFLKLSQEQKLCVMKSKDLWAALGVEKSNVKLDC